MSHHPFKLSEIIPQTMSVLIGERAKRARLYLVMSMKARDICICYSMGRSDIRDIFHKL